MRDLTVRIRCCLGGEICAVEKAAARRPQNKSHVVSANHVIPTIGLNRDCGNAIGSCATFDSESGYSAKRQSRCRWIRRDERLGSLSHRAEVLLESAL